MSELLLQLEKNLRDRIEAEEEKKKSLPKSWSLADGDRGSIADIATRMVIEAVKRIKGRAYAIESDKESARQFAAVALNARGKDLQRILTSIGHTHYLSNGRMRTIGLFQERPDPDDGVIDWPTDPQSKQPIRNPWLPLPKPKGDPPGAPDHFDHHSQNLIRQAAPRLAKWMQDAAKNNGVTMGMVYELEKERAQAEALRKVAYTEREWQANKLRKDLEPNLTKRMQFEKSITDKALLHYHKREAEMGAPRLFDNRTFLAQLRERDPEARELLTKAEQTYKEWKQAEESAEAAA